MSITKFSFFLVSMVIACSEQPPEGSRRPIADRGTIAPQKSLASLTATSTMTTEDTDVEVSYSRSSGKSGAKGHQNYETTEDTSIEEIIPEGYQKADDTECGPNQERNQQGKCDCMGSMADDPSGSFDGGANIYTTHALLKLKATGDPKSPCVAKTPKELCDELGPTFGMGIDKCLQKLVLKKKKNLTTVWFCNTRSVPIKICRVPLEDAELSLGDVAFFTTPDSSNAEKCGLEFSYAFDPLKNEGIGVQTPSASAYIWRDKGTGADWDGTLLNPTLGADGADYVCPSDYAVRAHVESDPLTGPRYACFHKAYFIEQEATAAWTCGGGCAKWEVTVFKAQHPDPRIGSVPGPFRAFNVVNPAKRKLRFLNPDLIKLTD